jgi:hypothetical protein
MRLRYGIIVTVAFLVEGKKERYDMARPAIYSSTAERMQAYRDRKRRAQAEVDRLERERQAEESRKREYCRQQDALLVSLAHELSLRRYPKGLPNGHTPATDALDLIECVLRQPEVVDKVLRACLVRAVSDGGG